MKVIVIGAGKLGFEIAKRLSEQDHDIVVIDKNAGALTEVANRLDVLTIQGNGASPLVLQQAEIGSAEIVIAVTDMDEVNMIACMAAKQYGVPVCAARIRNPEYTGRGPHALSHRQIGIDLILNPERLAALELLRLIKTPTATHVDYFAQGRVSLLRLRVDDDAPITRGPLREVDPQRCTIAAIVRNGEVVIPDGESRVQPQDRVYLMGRTGNFSEVRALLGSTAMTVKEVTIAGGGRIGTPLAEMLLPGLKRGMRVKLIERDEQRCAELAHHLPGVLVIHGDAEKIDVLREEMVDESDVFVAVTAQDHTNLLATMVAKQLRVPKAIVSVSREDYAPLAERAGADAVVVPRLIAASTALQLVRKRHVLSVTLLEEGKAEVLECVVGETAEAAHTPLRDLHALRGSIVAALVRDDEVLTPRGDMILLPGDHAIVFALPDAVSKVEGCFQG